MNQPQISVIVPVYNVEKYLSRCIESILSQTFTDFELLLIDDGSTDRSGEMCDEYAKKDTRIRVFHTKNRGVSAARNLGLDNAKGEWISFVDSDDWVEEDYLNKFFHYDSLSYESVVCQRFYVEDVSFPEKNRVSFEYLNDILKYPFEEKSIIKYKILEDVYVFAKLFNKKLIKEKNIRFYEKISICEDLIFFHTYLQYVKEIILCSSSSYHYIQRNIITLSKKFHNSEELLRASNALLKTNVLLLKTFIISNIKYVKRIYTFSGLSQVYTACINADDNNYSSIFNYVRNKKQLFDKYYYPQNLEQKLFKLLFFTKLIPNSLINLIFKYYKRILKIK